MPTDQDSSLDCYLQIRHGKTTIFTDVTEQTTIFELKQILCELLHVDSNSISLRSKGQTLDDDSKHLLEYGITSKDAQPQSPVQLEYSLRLDDGSWISDEIIPYANENTYSVDEQTSN